MVNQPRRTSDELSTACRNNENRMSGSAAARNEKKNVWNAVLQFLFEMRYCGIVFRGLQS